MIEERQAGDEAERRAASQLLPPSLLNLSWVAPVIKYRPNVFINISLPPGLESSERVQFEQEGGGGGTGNAHVFVGPPPTRHPRMGCCDADCTIMAVSCSAAGVASSPAHAPAPLLTPPALPTIIPGGGVYSQPVNVSVTGPSGLSVWLSINSSAWAPYIGPFEISEGATSVSAMTDGGGGRRPNSSAVTAEFTVVLCGSEDRCCRWRVLLARFEAALAALLAANTSDVAQEADLRNESYAARRAWLDAEADYHTASATAASAKDSAGYARRQAEKWRAAYGAGQAGYERLAARLAAEERGVDDERALIREILAMMDSGQLHGPAAAAALARVRAGAAGLGAGGEVAALASSLGGRFAEADEVRGILLQLLADLDRREQVDQSLAEQTLGTVQTDAARLEDWEQKAAGYFRLEDDEEEAARVANAARGRLAGLAEERARAAALQAAAEQGAAEPEEREAAALRAIIARVRGVLADCRVSPDFSAPGGLSDTAERLAAQVSTRLLGGGAAAAGQVPHGEEAGRIAVAHAGLAARPAGRASLVAAVVARGLLGGASAAGAAGGDGEPAGKAAAVRTVSRIKGMLSRLQQVLERRGAELRRAAALERIAERERDAARERARLAAARAAAAANTETARPAAKPAATATGSGAPAVRTVSEIKGLLARFRAELERRGADLRQRIGPGLPPPAQLPVESAAGEGLR